MRNGWKIELLKDGKWLVAGTRKFPEQAEDEAIRHAKKLKADAYRVTKDGELYAWNFALGVSK